jgi:hypothetical protein
MDNYSVTITPTIMVYITLESAWRVLYFDKFSDPLVKLGQNWSLRNTWGIWYKQTDFQPKSNLGVQMTYLT